MCPTLLPISHTPPAIALPAGRLSCGCQPSLSPIEVCHSAPVRLRTHVVGVLLQDMPPKPNGTVWYLNNFSKYWNLRRPLAWGKSIAPMSSKIAPKASLTALQYQPCKRYFAYLCVSDRCYACWQSAIYVASPLLFFQQKKISWKTMLIIASPNNSTAL